MIQMYNGANNYTVHLNSGKVLELTDADIIEISSENQETLDRINELVNMTIKYKALYEREMEKNESLEKNNKKFLEEIKTIITSDISSEEMVEKLINKIR